MAEAFYGQDPARDVTGSRGAPPRRQLWQVFRSGALLGIAGLVQWLFGLSTAIWWIKMTGVGAFAVGCLIATAALMAAEDRTADGTEEI